MSNFKPIHIIPDILNGEDIDVVIDKRNEKKFQKSDMEIETYESKEKSKKPQEYEDGGRIMEDDINEKKMNDPRIQATFKLSRHSFHNRSTILRNTETNYPS